MDITENRPPEAVSEVEKSEFSWIPRPSNKHFVNDKTLKSILAPLNSTIIAFAPLDDNPKSNPVLVHVHACY